MLENVSMGVKLAIGIGSGIAIWGLLRWLIHLVNKTSVEMNMTRSNKKPSQQQILRNVMNAESN
jgi:hypothetical protein